MRQNPRYSVIVPVYNAEGMLCQCIDSILAQEFKDFELIVVNDGSKDTSLQILKEYELKDSRIRIIDKPNGGVSSARNAGLDIAQGEYIVFVDADDYLEKDYLSNFSQYDADIIICGYKIYDRSGEQEMPKTTTFDKNEDIIRFVCDNVPKQFILTPWSKAFKRHLFENPQERYDSKIRFGEDIELNYRLFAKADSLQTINKTGYNYYWGDKKGKWILEPKEYSYTLKKLYEATELFPPESKERVLDIHRTTFYNFFLDALWVSPYRKAIGLSLKYFRHRVYHYLPYTNWMKLRKAAAILAIPHISLLKSL